MDVKFLLGFVVFATLYRFGYTCSCLRTTVSKKYCQADFVMKVRVLSKLKNPSGQQDFNDFYRIRRIGQPWKFRFESFVARKNRVYTASNGAMCGVYLQRWKRYLISGRVDKTGQKMRIDLCSSIYERTPLSRPTKRMQRRPPHCSVLSATDRFKMLARR